MPPSTLTRPALEKLVCEILMEVLHPHREEEVEPRHRLVDLGVDSLAYLNFWTTLESRRGYRVDDEDILGDVRSVSDLVDRVEQVERAKPSLERGLVQNG